MHISKRHIKHSIMLNLLKRGLLKQIKIILRVFNQTFNLQALNNFLTKHPQELLIFHSRQKLLNQILDLKISWKQNILSLHIQLNKILYISNQSKKVPSRIYLLKEQSLIKRERMTCEEIILILEIQKLQV